MLKFLYSVFFYSNGIFFYSNRMGLKFMNFELQMLHVMNCMKINKHIGNQQRNRHLHFPGQHYSFKDFSRLFHTYDHFKAFQDLENFYIKFQDFLYFSRICTNPDIGLSLIIASETEDRSQRGALQQLSIA